MVYRAINNLKRVVFWQLYFSYFSVNKIEEKDEPVQRAPSNVSMASVLSRGRGSDDGAETPKAFGKLAGLLVKSKL